MLSPASTEKESDAPDEGALMHRENDMKFEIPKLDRLQRPLSRDEVKSTRGLKTLERLANGPEIKTKYFP